MTGLLNEIRIVLEVVEYVVVMLIVEIYGVTLFLEYAKKVFSCQW